MEIRVIIFYQFMQIKYPIPIILLKMFKQFHISPAFHIRIVFLFQIHFNLQLHHIQMRKHYRIISYAGGFCALLFHIYVYIHSIRYYIAHRTLVYTCIAHIVWHNKNAKLYTAPLVDPFQTFRSSLRSVHSRCCRHRPTHTLTQPMCLYRTAQRQHNTHI